MKASHSIPDGVLDNRQHFTHSLFEQIELESQKIALTDVISKDYLFPTLYGDVSCAIGIFLADYVACAKLLTDDRLQPIKMPRGKAVVAISSYIYRRVLGVPPYNEIAMTIPVQFNPRWAPPVLPLLKPSWFPSVGYWVFSMPVTSEENRLRGLKIWGLPKEAHDIEIVEQSGHSVTHASVPGEDPYFKMQIPRHGKLTHFNVSSWVYSEFEGKLVRSKTHFTGDFNVQKYNHVIRRPDTPVQQPFIEYGNGPIADTLRALNLSNHPIQTRFCDHTNSWFGRPNST